MKNTTLVAAIACLGAFACGAAKATLDQFTTLDFPGTPLTVAHGINDAGTIVGNTSPSVFGTGTVDAIGGFIFWG